MKYLFNYSQKIFTSINRTPRIYLFLDYDGTLTPIVKKPELANLPPNVKSILLKLTKNPKFSIAIISGRSIKQLKGKVKIKDIALAGNHGLEMELPSGTAARRGVESPTLKYVHPLARKIRPVTKNIKHKLDIACKPIKGTFIEDKGLTLSVHYRLVKGAKIKKLKHSVIATLTPYIESKKVKITNGKKVIEVRPPIKWGKGSLVDYLLKRKKNKRRRILPIYLGDDETDESAFKRLKKKGITIFVGGKNTVSNAEYYVGDTKEVFRFLSGLTTN
ncbi:MAG: trehalose-phosphatase [Candidatus Omnitrophota bacterium]|nr:MAG: trehalose-phosphatase [Candidatus Omnitrophota bacterium]